MKVNISDLKIIYEEEIKKNVKNKKKILEFERNKIEYLLCIKNLLESGEYNAGRYNIFLVYKPKIRVVMSQSVYDKIINHYIARFILIPKLENYLNNRNCATRKNMGTSYAIELLKNDLNDEELNIVKIILNSTNHSYINKVIENYENKLGIELPKYYYNKGLPIGNMTSQFLSIFYLSRLQHYIRHIKIKNI